MNEIGSEFWLENFNKYENCKFDNLFDLGKDISYLFSGRTAIDYVLEDIGNHIKKVYMPSYLCNSMMQPFFDRNINIEFYEVIIKNNGLKYVIDYEKQVDVFFATSYFGFLNTAMDFAIKNFKAKNIIVIEDITHRLLCEQNYCKKADYLIASIRKWFPLPSGGLAVKRCGYFNKQLLSVPPSFLINTKIKAMKKKADYIKNHNLDATFKREYLALFSHFNKCLKKFYKGKKIDERSKKLLLTIDIINAKKKRRENASFLYKALKKYKYIKPLFNEINFKNDCPLFFPLKINNLKLRDLLKEYLIDNKIYCPNHWPISENIMLNNKTKKIYNVELSLVCDQRYNINDMIRIVNTIKDFFANKNIKLKYNEKL